MRVAAIDVGTNSTRLLIAEATSGGYRPLQRRTIVTRLGQGVDRTRALAPEALQRTLSTIADYAATCGEVGVDRLRVTGTSAVRDARNREEFFEGVRRLTGHPPELLSGEAEARTTFAGAASDLPSADSKLVVDIGGGSTELIVGDSSPQRLVSLEIGCVRLFEKHLKSDPPTGAEQQALGIEVRSMLDGVNKELDVPPETRLVGVAGTVTQLVVLRDGLPVHDPDVTHHAVLLHSDVRRLARRLGDLSFDQRRRVKGLEPGRADVIVAGAGILLGVMDVFSATEILVSEKDILDGLVLELLAD